MTKVRAGWGRDLTGGLAAAMTRVRRSAMEKFTKLEGVAAPLKMVNVDTDMIIPADYLKTLKRTGLAKGLFSRIRRRARGSRS